MLKDATKCPCVVLTFTNCILWIPALKNITIYLFKELKKKNVWIFRTFTVGAYTVQFVGLPCMNPILLRCFIQLFKNSLRVKLAQSFLYGPCADPEGGGGGAGVRTPLPKKILSFLAILVQIPWRITKLTSWHSMLGHHKPMMARL